METADAREEIVVEMVSRLEGSSSKLAMVWSSEESVQKVVDELDMDYLTSAAVCEADECLRRLANGSGGNIFHIAVKEDNVQFMEGAMKILPDPILQSLLSQQQNEQHWNPLHIAAQKWDHKMVDFILDYYRSKSLASLGQSAGERNIHELLPWLQQDYVGRTPLLCALSMGAERSASEILSMDPVLLSNIEDNEGRSALFQAVESMHDAVALQILTSAPNCSFSGHNGQNAVCSAAHRSDQVFELVVQMRPQLTRMIDSDERTMLHHWAWIDNVYPLKYVLKSNVIAPQLRRDFISQLSIVENRLGRNALHEIGHSLTNDDDMGFKMAKILVDAFKQEKAQVLSSSEFQHSPWLIKDKEERTPLHAAIENEKQELALYLFSLDKIQFLLDNDNLLFWALKHQCPKLVEETLEIVHQDKQFMHLLTKNNGLNALHYAPKSTEPCLRVLLKYYDTFRRCNNNNGVNPFHKWIKIGELWPFQYVLNRDNVSLTTLYPFIGYLKACDVNGKNPLHWAAEFGTEIAVVEIMQLLFRSLPEEHEVEYIWCALKQKDDQGYVPVRRALSTRREKLVLFFLQILRDGNRIGIAGDDVLFTAIEYNCDNVTEYLFNWVRKDHDKKSFLSSNGQNVLHIPSKYSEENCKFIVETFPELLNEQDKDGKTPLDRAAEAGMTWLVKLILKKDRTSILKAPKAWVEACKNSHLSTVMAFVHDSPYLRSICHKNQDSPLHHLKFLTYTEYQEFLEFPLMKELKNSRNFDGKTPLHKAIENRDKDFAEVLLSMKDVDRNVKDKHRTTAMGLLTEACKQNKEWREMCEAIGVDPTLKTSYIQSETDLSEMRNIISLVAALLATITFTAGFTLPGGLDSNNGYAMLVKQAAFLVFIITNSYAMCCSMLILFCIIWSMICKRDESLLLIDRSLVLLKQSLYGTLLAFMTGVYMVIHHKSLWSAIVIIVMCSSVVILASKKTLIAALKLIPTADEEQPLRWLRCWNKGKQQVAPQNNNQRPEELAATLRDEREPELDSIFSIK